MFTHNNTDFSKKFSNQASRCCLQYRLDKVEAIAFLFPVIIAAALLLCICSHLYAIYIPGFLFSYTLEWMYSKKLECTFLFILDVTLCFNIILNCVHFFYI